MKRRLHGGFTLIEVVIALALGVIVIGSAILILEQVVIANRRQRIVSELQRDGEFVTQLMTQEIRQAGLGVPTGFQIAGDQAGANNGRFNYGTNSAGTTTPLVFPARRLIVAGANQIGIVGDLPRPDANYNVFGPIHDRVPGDPNLIAWHTEDNGTCIPPGCATGTASTFFQGAADCTAGTFTRTCPWALRRIAPGERLQIVDGAGDWGVNGVSASLTPVNSTNGILSLTLLQGVDLETDPVGQPARWQNGVAPLGTADDGPGGIIGQGFVTTLDRVFYKLTGTTIVRTQCWGDPDPNNTNWPPSGSNAVPATPNVGAPPTAGGMTSANVQAASTCIGPEVVARNVSAFQINYFTSSGIAVPTIASTPASTLNTIASVQWLITFSKTDNTIKTPVSFTIEGGTALVNN